MKPRHTWPGALLTVLFMSMLLTACQQGSEHGDEEKDETPAIPVEISTATRADIYATYSGTAPVEAFEDASVIAKVGGEVREIFVEEGDFVEKGQVLARLDGDKLRLEQKQTAANLGKLQRDYQRNVDLKDRGLISDGDFEKILYEMEALDAANNLASLQLSYAEVRAPIDGVISERFIKLGNTLEIEAPTFHVTSLEPLISYLHVPEREYRKMVPGQDAAMIVDALGGATFAGTVVRVSPIVDPVTGTFKITIEVRDDTRRLKPGMFARIAIVHDMHANAMQVPRSALVGTAGSTAVFVVDDDIARRRLVTIGYSSEGNVEITDGLADSEKFVTVGQGGLKDGAKVFVINNASPGESAAQIDVTE